MPNISGALRQETATVVFVDVVESVRLMADAEFPAVPRIRELLARARRLVAACRGCVAERRGDGMLLTFATARDAARCAGRLHALTFEEQAEHPGSEPLRLRIGLHRTELLADDEALYGHGVNLAARIAALGRPGDTLLSAAARDELVPPLDGLLEDLGPCWLKNVDAPLRLFRHSADHPPLPSTLEAAIRARMKLRPTIAVMPLDDAQGRLPSTAAPSFGLGDVAVDSLVGQLSQSSLLHVISALSVRALHGRELPLEDVYALLRADYVLRVRVAADSEGTDRNRCVRLGFELWRRGSDEAVWSDGLQGTVLDLLSASSDLLGPVVHAVSHRILAVEHRAARCAQAMPNLASHTLHLAAVDLLHRFSAEEFARARELLVALAERAPRHAEPMAWLARWHVFRVVQGWSDDSRRDGEQALHYSDRALDRDPCSALALTMAGSVQVGVNRDAAAAQTLYGEALRHDPNHSLAWLMSGVAQGFLNTGAPALVASEMALGLAPADPTRHFYDALSATAALAAGEHDRCISLARRAIVANAAHGSPYRSMAIAQIHLGRHAEAATTIQRLLAVEPHFTVKVYLARLPQQDVHRERHARMLEKAGLPAS